MRDAEEKFLVLPTIEKNLDAPHRIVALLHANGNIWVATEQRVYIVVDNTLRPVPFEITGDEKT